MKEIRGLFCITPDDVKFPTHPRVISWFGLIAILHCHNSIAMPPIVLTNDKSTVVDLTGTPLLEKYSLQDCQLRLEGEMGMYRLTYSGGAISVPTKAVKTMRDGVVAEVGIKGKLDGMVLMSLRVSYFKMPVAKFNGIGAWATHSQGFSGSGVRGNEYDILIAGREETIKNKLIMHWRDGVVLSSKTDPNVNAGVLLYLSDLDIMPAGGEYGYEPLSFSKRTTTVHTICRINGTNK